MASLRRTGNAHGSGAKASVGPDEVPATHWIDRIALRIRRPRSPSTCALRLGQRNVFVLPTRAGIGYGVVLLAMLIASINYALSLGFMLTFLCGAIGLVAMLHTFRNLSGLELRPGRAEPAFAAGHAEVGLQLHNPDRRGRHALRIEAPGLVSSTLVDLDAGAGRLTSIAIPASHRGWLAMPRLRIRTEFPLGLFRAWAYWQPPIQILIYPKPEPPGSPLPLSAGGDTGSGAGLGEEDVAAVRPYRAGDVPQRIAWRAVARSSNGELLSKQLEGGTSGVLCLDWSALPGSLDTEAKVSRLTRWVLDADASGQPWSLHLPAVEVEAGEGPAQRARCLEALALLDA
jgi:uncharacterized protein (DUF58 family)